MLRFVTLYLVLVLVSAIVITFGTGANFGIALATASVGCIFKTIAAHGHSLLFDKWQQKAVAYDVELAPCKCE